MYVGFLDFVKGKGSFMSMLLWWLLFAGPRIDIYIVVSTWAAACVRAVGLVVRAGCPEYGSSAAGGGLFAQLACVISALVASVCHTTRLRDGFGLTLVGEAVQCVPMYL
jgi:hypothetical protein